MVDDDPQTLRLVRDALTGAGYDPLVTGEHEGLGQVLAREKPALILLDYTLPGTDGVELMERVPGLSDAPVIFISGYGRDETVARPNAPPGRPPNSASTARQMIRCAPARTSSLNSSRKAGFVKGIVVSLCMVAHLLCAE